MCPRGQAAREDPDQTTFWTDPRDSLRVFSAQPLPVADRVPRLAVLSQARHATHTTIMSLTRRRLEFPRFAR